MNVQTAGVGILLLASLMHPAAADEKYYAGVSVGYAKLAIDTGGEEYDDSDYGAFKVFGGFRVSEQFALEAAYFKLGTFEDTIAAVPLDVDISGWQAFGVIHYAESERLDLFVKAGVVSWTADISAPGFAIGDEDDTDFAMGFGASLTPAERFTWRTEFEWFDMAHTESSWLLSVGGQYSF